MKEKPKMPKFYWVGRRIYSDEFTTITRLNDLVPVIYIAMYEWLLSGDERIVVWCGDGLFSVGSILSRRLDCPEFWELEISARRSISQRILGEYFLEKWPDSKNCEHSHFFNWLERRG